MNNPKTTRQIIEQFIRQNPQATYLDYRRWLLTMEPGLRNRVSSSMSDLRTRKGVRVPWGDETRGKSQTQTTRRDDDATEAEYTGDAVTELKALFSGTDRIPFGVAVDRLDIAPSELRGLIVDIRAREGIEIAEVDGELVFGVVTRSRLEPLATQVIRFGVASDLHI
jgi:hypothetical protein